MNLNETLVAASHNTHQTNRVIVEETHYDKSNEAEDADELDCFINNSVQQD